MRSDKGGRSKEYSRRRPINWKRNLKGKISNKKLASSNSAAPRFTAACYLVETAYACSRYRSLSSGFIEHSRLIEHAVKLIGDRLEQVAQHCATSSLQEDLNRHTGHQGHAVQAMTFPTRQTDYYSVKIFISLLIVTEVGRDICDGSRHLGHGRSVQGRESQISALIDRNLIDLVRRQVPFNFEGIGVGNDFHDDVARTNDASNCVDRQLVNNAGGRGPNFDAIALVPGRYIGFREFRFLILRFAKILHNLGPKILIDLRNLQLGLAYLCFRCSNCGR